MKKRYFVFLMVLLSVSCRLSRFDRYPGQAMKEFPENIRGEYRMEAKGLRGLFRSSQLDSARVRVSAHTVQFLSDKGWETEFTISPSEVLSNEGSYFFLSKKDENEPAYWNTSILQLQGKGLMIHNVDRMETDFTKDPLKDYLALKLLVRNGKAEHTEIVDPSNAEMVKRIGNIPSNSQDSIYYYVMNEERFLRFAAKELNNRNGILFEKVTDKK